MSVKENINNITIPKYSPVQEMANMLSHALGVPLAITIIIIGLYQFFNGLIGKKVLLGVIVFGISALLVYLFSAIYHGMKKDSFAKKVLRVVDHCLIYLLIAGTYTPVCFMVMNKSNLGLVMLIIEWVGAVIGIVLNAFFFTSKIARIISFILYIVMGWLCAFVGGWLYIPTLNFFFILLGGVIYTIGSILYALGHSNRWFHFVFHIFVLIGTIIQTIGVFYH